MPGLPDGQFAPFTFDRRASTPTNLRFPPSLDRRRFIKSGALPTASGTLLSPTTLTADRKKRIGVGQPDRTAELYRGFVYAVHAEADELGYEWSGPLAPDRSRC